MCADVGMAAISVVHQIHVCEHPNQCIHPGSTGVHTRNRSQTLEGETWASPIEIVYCGYEFLQWTGGFMYISLTSPKPTSSRAASSVRDLTPTRGIDNVEWNSPKPCHPDPERLRRWGALRRYKSLMKLRSMFSLFATVWFSLTADQTFTVVRSFVLLGMTFQE